MSDKGILFKPDMAKAADEGRKTKTRRVIKHPKRLQGLMLEGEEPDWCPFSVGQRLYLKETHYRYGKWVKNGKTKTGKHAWRFVAKPDSVYWFMDDALPFVTRNWRPNSYREESWYKRNARFMPKSLARNWYRVTAVRCERIQDITGEDAQAEGWPRIEEIFPSINPSSKAKEWFRRLWESIHGIDNPKSWESNPWVWCVTFEKIEDYPGQGNAAKV